MKFRLFLSSLLLSILLEPLAPARANIFSPSGTRASPLDEMTSDGRPTPAGIAVLQSHTRHSAARVWVGDTRFDIRRVRVDSLGITFLDAPRTDRRLGGGLVTPDHAADSRTSASLVPWTTIDRLETKHSYLWQGIVGGLALGALASALWSDSLPYEPGAAAIVIAIAVPPTGALLGGLVGGSVTRWRHEWPPAIRSSAITR